MLITPLLSYFLVTIINKHVVTESSGRLNRMDTYKDHRFRDVFRRQFSFILGKLCLRFFCVVPKLSDRHVLQKALRISQITINKILHGFNLFLPKQQRRIKYNFNVLLVNH